MIDRTSLLTNTVVADPVKSNNRQLIEALEALIEPGTRGDPCSPLRWTCKSTRTLARELTRQGFTKSAVRKSGNCFARKVTVCRPTARRLKASNILTATPNSNTSTSELARFCERGNPRSRSTRKKKEPLGNMKNAGQTYRPKGKPTKVTTHDFPDRKLGKAVPYGVYDIALNEAGVSVGISHDTAEFAVAAIHRWWKRMGKKRYPSAKRLLITADCGGSNSPRTRLWRWTLQQFSNKTGLKIELCHYPPGTSKWNKIEHRLFCHITRNWQGVPLESHEIVVNLIGSTKTEEGLEVHAWLDKSKYEKSKKVSDDRLAEVQIKRNTFHGEWNYQILPIR